MATSNKTFIKKITVGVPIRKVTGAEAQTLSDITDVTSYDSVGPGYLLVFNNATQRWRAQNYVDQGFVLGGGFASLDSPGGDF